VDVTAISVPASFTNALAQMGNTTSIPSVIPLPKLNIRKGVPAGIDLGFSFIKVSVYEIYGADVQWAFFRGNVALPTLAVRASANKADLDMVHTRTYDFDVIVSKSVTVAAEPYFGIGMQNYN